MQILAKSIIKFPIREEADTETQGPNALHLATLVSEKSQTLQGLFCEPPSPWGTNAILPSTYIGKAISFSVPYSVYSHLISHTPNSVFPVHNNRSVFRAYFNFPCPCVFSHYPNYQYLYHWNFTETQNLGTFRAPSLPITPSSFIPILRKQLLATPLNCFFWRCAAGHVRHYCYRDRCSQARCRRLPLTLSCIPTSSPFSF